MTLVYKAKFQNGKCYIGITNNLVKRISRHKSCVKKGSNCYFHNAIRKYGLDTIVWEILYTFNDRKDAENMERVLIQECQPNYNINLGYESLMSHEELSERFKKNKVGRIHSNETKAKISISNKLNKKCNSTEDNSTRYRNFMIGFYNGTLSSTTVANLKTLNEIFVEGMSLLELEAKSGISKTSILRYQRMWTVEYIPFIPSEHIVKLKKIRQTKDRNKTKIFSILDIEYEKLNKREICQKCGLFYKKSLSIIDAARDMIIEEGF